MEHLAIIPILVFLMIAHEWGHFIVARKTGITVEEFAIGFPPRLFSREVDGVRYSLNLIPFGAYVKMLGEEDPSEPGSFAAQSKRVRALVLAAGSGMNFLVAVAVFALAYATGWPDPRQADVLIGGIVADSPAQRADLRAGDMVVRANGREIRSVETLQQEIGSHAGQNLRLEINRQGELVNVDVVPNANSDGRGLIGVQLQPRAGRVPHAPLESIAFGILKPIEIIAMTVGAIAMAVRGDIAPELLRPIGLPGMTMVAGGAANAAVSGGGWFPILLITGAFSASLAFANMLPLPALDGGRLLFVAIEAVRGRRVSPEREGLVHLVGMVVLISLMVAISFYDLAVPPATIDWGVR